MVGQPILFLKWPSRVLTTRSCTVLSGYRKHLVWRLSVKYPVLSLQVVERQVSFQALLRCADDHVGVQIDLLDVMIFPSRSTNALSRQHPFPYMLIGLLKHYGIHMNSWLVIWHPWSVLKMVGVPYRVIASCTASRQKTVVSVLNRRHTSPQRLAQARTAN